MRDIEWLKRKAGNYGLVADYINDDSLKVHCPKYMFDSWMIIETEDSIELWHMSKNYGVKNITYHLQKSVPKFKKLWALQRIVSHNRYKAVNNHKVNIVDKLLAQENKRLAGGM